MLTREKIINNYIEGYNELDIDKMMKDFDESITFENISNGETNMSLTGLKAFREQAEQAKDLFSIRTQTVRSYVHRMNETEIEINFSAILASDVPNWLKKGSELKLQGRSIFKFSGDKIIKLTDVS